MSPTTTRVLRAITEKIATHDLTDCAGGFVEIRVKLDSAGCPRRVAVKTEVEYEVERAPSCERSALLLRK